MALDFKRIFEGIQIVPKTTSDVDTQGELDVTIATGKLNYHNGTTSSPIVTETQASQGTNRLKNKDLEDSTVLFVDNADVTKKMAFQLSGITTGTTRTITVPDSDLTLVGTSTTQTLSNKTLDNSNIITVKDANFTIQDDSDTTKQAKFQLSGITTGNTRTFTLPDITDTIVVLTATQTLTNKTLSGNTATNLISGSGTFTFNTSGTVTVPNGTDTLVARTSTDQGANRLQNKDVSANNFKIVDASDTTKKIAFDASNVSTGVVTTISMPSNSSSISYSLPLSGSSEILVALNTTQTLKNKTLDDTTTLIANTSDSTKQFKFSAASITTATTRTITIPDASFTMVGTTTTQTLTNKTLTTPETDVILMDEQSSAPSTPASGKLKFYAKTDNQLYYKDPSGTENLIASSASPLSFFASSQVTTASSALLSVGFTTFANSPAFSVTPTSTGTYKVYCAIPLTNGSTANGHGEARIIKTSGAGTLLYESIGGVVASNASADVSDSLFAQSVYTLTASVTYVFDIQGRISDAAPLTTRGDLAPFYMFCERVG